MSSANFTQSMYPQAPPPERFPVSDGRDRERERERDRPPRSGDRDRREPDRVRTAVAAC